MPPRLRLPNARTLATTASEVFTSEIYETLSEVVVWVRAFDKVDGRELWRKRYSHANQAIITTALNASISIDLLAQGGILGYTLRNTRDGKTLIATAALDAVNGNVLWQNARTADAASFANFSWRTLPTTGGNFIFIDTSSSQVQTLFNRTGNIIRLLSNAGRYPIDGESFIVYEGKRFRREAEVSGEVLWQTPHLGDEFNWSRLWCMRDNKAYISSSIGDKENVGYIDLNSAAVVMNETPNFPGYWAAISSTGAPYWPKCLGEFNFTIEYISNQGPRFALGFDGLGNQLWRKSHSNIFIRHRIFSGAHYPVDLLEHPDPYLPQSVTFSGRIDAKGESRGYSGSFNKFEGASFKVIAGTPVETNIRIYERRTDQASSFELISLPPIEQRPIVELQVTELNIELIDPTQLKYQVRVKNAGTHPAMGVRVVADTGLYAEIDLPTANSFVDFEFVRNRFANIGKISAVPAYDVLEANPYDNILVLRPDVHDGFE